MEELNILLRDDRVNKEKEVLTRNPEEGKVEVAPKIAKQFILSCILFYEKATNLSK